MTEPRYRWGTGSKNRRAFLVRLLPDTDDLGIMVWADYGQVGGTWRPYHENPRYTLTVTGDFTSWDHAERYILEYRLGGGRL